jgi:hypothetical protein
LTRIYNHTNMYGSAGKHHRDFWAGGLLIVRSFISRMVNLVSVTQQDLMEAGVYLHQTRD